MDASRRDVDGLATIISNSRRPIAEHRVTSHQFLERLPFAHGDRQWIVW
jgi:hypothetical protein